MAHPHYEEGEGEDHHLVLLLTSTAYCCFYPHYEEGEGEDYVVAVHQLRSTAPGADQVPGLALGSGLALGLGLGLRLVLVLGFRV